MWVFVKRSHHAELRDLGPCGRHSWPGPVSAPSICPLPPAAPQGWPQQAPGKPLNTHSREGGQWGAGTWGVLTAHPRTKACAVSACPDQSTADGS